MQQDWSAWDEAEGPDWSAWDEAARIPRAMKHFDMFLHNVLHAVALAAVRGWYQ